MKKRIGIFYVNAGGGHSGTAKALAKEILENYSDKAEVVLVDAMGGGKFLTRWLLERGYALAINNFPHNWRVIYWLSKLRSIMRGEDKFFTTTIRKNITEKIEQENFDIIITVHFFLTSPVLSILSEKNINALVYSVVTDPFTVPPLWFLNKEIKYFVFSESAKTVALKNGVNEGNVEVVLPVINKKFSIARNLDKLAVRKKLGLPLDKKIILVAAGGDGLYRGGEIVKNLVNLPDDFRVLVVCGREKKFYEQAECEYNKHPDKILLVAGFVDNIEELMVVSDLIVGKAGPATIFEALAVGRPLVLTHYIWEQEKGNCDFVVNGKYGKYEPKIHNLNKVIEALFDDKSGFEEVENRINKLVFKTGAEEIVKKILEIKNPE